MSTLLQLKTPPMGLYIHLPWCVRKCPYCDFNSCVRPSDAEAFRVYVDALVRELDLTCNIFAESFEKEIRNRPLVSIYFGGGTPSLFAPSEFARIIDAVEEKFTLEKDCEISMEANPGTVDRARLLGYKEAGINRISLGVQSLNDDELKRLHRIHDSATAIKAIEDVASIFDNFNLDLMHSLPGQTTSMALVDLEEAIKYSPPHLSWYQLTIEEDTAFGEHVPLELPSEDTIENTVVSGFKLLEDAGYRHYEVSAFAQLGHECKHNTNYWRFGDYLALGAGAHGKITTPDGIVRTSNFESPKAYMDAVFNGELDLNAIKAKQSSLLMDQISCYGQDINRATFLATRLGACSWMDDAHVVDIYDLSFEYFLNRLRLFEAVPLSEFTAFTGLSFDEVAEPLNKCAQEGLLTITDESLSITPKGHLFVNAMLEEFL